MNITHDKYKKSYLFSFIITTVIFLLKVPINIALPQPGLDPSWVVGLNWALIKNLQFGKDIIFTYGPYFFLSEPILLFNDLDRIIIQNVFYCSLVFFIIFRFTIESVEFARNSLGGKVLFIIGEIFLLLTSEDLTFLISSISYLFFIKIIFKKGNDWLLIFGLSFLLSTLSLVKFSFVPVSCVLSFLIFIKFLVIDKEKLKSLSSLFFPILLFTIMWLFQGQKPVNIFSYLLSGFSLLTGYSEGMQVTTDALIGKNILKTTLFLFCLLFFILSLKKKKLNLTISLAVLCFLVFIAYKNGIVRSDMYHERIFVLQISSYLLVIPILLNFEYMIKENPKIFSILSLIWIFCFMGLPFNKNILFPIKNWEQKISMIKNDRFELISHSKAILKESYPIDQSMIELIGNRSIDVLPWDISMAYAYDMNWSPNPVFQSYAVYTPYLDNLGYNFYSGDNAPDLVLFKYSSIDGRYPVFDEPKVIKAVFEAYKPVITDNEYVLLERQDETKKINEKPIQSGFIVLNDDLFDLSLENSISFLYLDTQLSLIGKLVNVIYKISPLNIEITYGDGKTSTYRFVRMLANDGFFISCYISDKNDFQYLVSSAKCNQPVKSYRIIGNDLFYKKKIPYTIQTVATE